MLLPDLRAQVCEANRALVPSGLVRLTWGNVSGIDRTSGLWAIKPSGVDYAAARSRLRTSSSSISMAKLWKVRLVPRQTPKRICTFTASSPRSAVSLTRTVFTPPCFPRPVVSCPAYGTTHADHFHGTVPVVRALTPEEVAADYEHFTGVAIVERFRELGLSPLEMPAVLQLHHAPFTFGKHAMDSVNNSIALETCAHMAHGSFQLNRPCSPSPPTSWKSTTSENTAQVLLWAGEALEEKFQMGRLLMNAKTWQTLCGFAALPFIGIGIPAILNPRRPDWSSHLGSVSTLVLIIFALLGAWFGLLFCLKRLYFACPFCNARSRVTSGSKKHLFLDRPSCGSVCVSSNSALCRSLEASISR